MADIEDMYAQEAADPSVTIIYGTALEDSYGGEVRVQIGEPIGGVTFDAEDLGDDVIVEMDDFEDSVTDEDFEAEQPYTSEDEGADDDPPDVIAAEETNITDSEDEVSVAEGDGEYPAVDPEDPLTQEVDEV